MLLWMLQYPIKMSADHVFCRSLCVDALIELSDENADWKLSFDEFLNCLRPGYNPPERSKIYNPLLHFTCEYTEHYLLITSYYLNCYFNAGQR